MSDFDAIVVGAQADYRARHLGEPPEVVMPVALHMLDS